MDSVGTPSSGGLSLVGGTVLSVCDGMTYTQLLDHGYGLTPITPSNSKETTTVTPGRTQVRYSVLICLLICICHICCLDFF